MKVLFTTIAGPALLVAAWVATSPAQTAMCPPEVASAKAMLTARGGEALASRSQDVQAPRTQGVEAARSQEVQSPRSQDVQAPRGQDVQAPRDRTATAPGRNTPAGSTARLLVREAEAACQSGNTAQAREKALAALEIMKQ